MDTQDVIFDAAVNAEEMYAEIEMNQEAIMNAHFKQNWVETEIIFTFFGLSVVIIQKIIFTFEPSLTVKPLKTTDNDPAKQKTKTTKILPIVGVYC